MQPHKGRNTVTTTVQLSLGDTPTLTDQYFDTHSASLTDSNRLTRSAITPSLPTNMVSAGGDPFTDNDLSDHNLIPHDFNEWNVNEILVTSDQYSYNPDVMEQDLGNLIVTTPLDASFETQCTQWYNRLCFTSRIRPFDPGGRPILERLPPDITEYDFTDHSQIIRMFDINYYKPRTLVDFPSLCDINCHEKHFVGPHSPQLSLCNFVREAYFHPTGVDINADYIVSGIRDGFSIVDPEFNNSYNCENYPSAYEPGNKKLIDKTLRLELEHGKITHTNSTPNCVHAIAAISKKGGGIRNVVDCKRPLGISINNFMCTTCEKFHYTSLDIVSADITPACFMAVLDIKSAYRAVNIDPTQTKFQGISWTFDTEKQYFLDNCLSFGLTCSPFIFTMLTDFVIRAMRRRGFLKVFGYIDDYIILADSQEECVFVLNTLIRLLRTLGFHLSYEKFEGPSQFVTYLGINIDSINMELSLPPDKVDTLNKLVGKFQTKHSATRKELEKLCGYLAHASTVVRGGRTFSRRAIDLLKQFPTNTHTVTLPDWFKQDMKWWSNFVTVFNGKNKIIDDRPIINAHLATDSSLSGFGATFGNDWLLGTWDNITVNLPGVNLSAHTVQAPSLLPPDPNINLLELWPVLAGAMQWGHSWSGAKVRLLSDNTQVVSMVATGRSTSPLCMQWLRELFWLSVIYNFHLISAYIPSEDNTIPDYLSRITNATPAQTCPFVLQNP